jgi:organic hydroperoxide reductase OsmC/OhrA
MVGFQGASLLVATRRRIGLPADLAVVVGATFQRDPADRLLGADEARELVAKAEEICRCAKMTREGMRYA